MRLVNILKLETLLKIALLLFGLYLTISLISYTFDGDFGWHLRFGKDVILNNFQYADSYSWSFFGKNWVNHEWGGDILFYLLYSNLGHFSLVILISLSLWLGFLLINKIFFKKLSLIAITISIISLLAVDFIITMRLSMLSIPFLVMLIYLLENVEKKKTYIYFPILIWIWSVLHGSWILAFIVINIYLFGSILSKILIYFKEEIPLIKIWNNLIIKKVILWQVISGIVIMINPYTYQIWHEVLLYFTNNYYKQHITEWLPSYSYPIYIAPLIIGTVSAILILLAYKEKKISFTHLLLFVFFAISAWQYKRNNIYLVLICIPVLTSTITYVAKNIKIKKDNKEIVGYIILAIIIFGIVMLQKPNIRYTSDVWQDKALLEYYAFPYQSTKVLDQKIGGQKNVRIFNEYSWGGYLIWNIPNTLVFTDGRSAATWKDPDGKLVLQKQMDLVTQPNGLKYMEENNVSFVILRKNYSGYNKPDWINRSLLGEEKLKILTTDYKYQLIKDLEKSNSWKKIYEDKISELWQLTASKDKN